MGKVFKALTKSMPVSDPVVEQDKENGIVSAMVEEVQQEVCLVKPQESAGQSSTSRDWDERLAVLTGKHPEILESFRRLRTKIVHPVKGSPAKTILITSALPEEGKSFVCANLGCIIAQGVDQHALVVGCDLRRPVMARLFGRDNDRGLVHYLRDGTDVADLIVPTGLKRLSLLPAGPPPANPAELLSSEKMTALIDELADRYSDRFILLDTPPGQAASETAVLAQHVDGVILVVRWGRAGREMIQQFVQTLGKEKIIGVVFNAFEMTIIDSKMKQEGYYKYYSEQYG
ncbi:MAG: polysaccharide biosynthesis tyrosine autokinase [Desulfobulbaceae bacterium]|nr:polysaccharide biosynthesis tyrosine autokinase [Desulfobulbaceae bacterium]